MWQISSILDLSRKSLHQGTVLYADFGVSRDYSDREHSATEGNPGAFTPKYCAPEVKEFEKRTSKSDVFSLGCVYFLMYAALSSEQSVLEIPKRPFHEQLDTIHVALMRCQKAPKLVQCIRNMLEYQEDERPWAIDVVHALSRKRETYFCMECRDQART